MDTAAWATLIAAVGTALGILLTKFFSIYKEWRRTSGKESTDLRKDKADAASAWRDEYGKMRDILMDHTAGLRLRITKLEEEERELRDLLVTQADKVGRFEERMKLAEDADAACTKELSALKLSHEKLLDDYAALQAELRQSRKRETP